AGAVLPRDGVVAQARELPLRLVGLPVVEPLEDEVAEGGVLGDPLEGHGDGVLPLEDGLAAEDAAEVAAEGLADREDDPAAGGVDGDLRLEVEDVVGLEGADAVEAVEAEGLEERLLLADLDAGERALGRPPDGPVEHA